MKKLNFKWLLLSIILSIASLNTAWAAQTYFYSGEGNGGNWSKTAMTVSTDGFYEYYKITSSTTHQFKIGTSSNQWAYNYSYVTSGFHCTNVTEIGDYGSDNCYCWKGSTHYILVYYPSTAVNSTANPIICASTTLPRDYAITVATASSTQGTVSPTSGYATSSSSCGLSISASPKANYAFYNWTVTSGTATIASSTSASTTVSASAASTVTANFVPQWTLKGGDSDDTGNSSSDAMGNWDTFNNFALTSGTTMKCTLALAAKTTYSFKIVDRRTNTWYGNNSAFMGQTSSLTMNSSLGDCHITTAKAGNYIFTFDNSAKTLTVTYPTETHPSVNYIYFKNTASWSTVYAHMWNATHTADAYPGPALPTFTFNGGTYYYAAIGSETTVIFGNNNDSRKTGDLASANTHTRQYYEYSSSSWKDFTVSISYKDVGNTAFSGTHEVGYPTIHTYGTSTTLDSPTKDNYNFDGWFQNSTGTGSSVSTISGTAKSADFTLYAKWSEITHEVRAHYGTGGSAVTPSSWTAFGVVTGGAVSATNATGYHFNGWTIDDSKGGSFTDASSASTTFFPTDDDTWITANFAPNTYTITLDGNEGSDGSATATYNNSTLTITHSSRVGYSLDGYFTATSGGTKVINADGTLVASAGSYTNSSSQWIYDDDVELHAQWTENLVNYTVTYGVKSDQTSLGTLSCATTTGSTPVSSGGEVASGTGVTFTAVPITGYEVDAWCSDAACNTPIAGAGYANTYATTVNANTTVYVKFKKKVYTITYSPSSAPTGCTYTTKPANGTYGNTVTMVFTPSTGYTVSVSAVDASSNTVTISNPSTNTYTFTQPASAVTVTVTATEIKSTITVTANNTSAGSLKFGETSKTWGQTPSLGVTTTQAMTATAGDGYVFCNWVLSGAAVSASDLAGATITLKADGSGNTGTATAKFYDDYYYRGGQNSWGATKMTPHTCGYYAYYEASTGAHEFKITPNSNNYTGEISTYDNTYGDITLTGGGGSNVYCPGDAGDGHFICVLYPSTAVNDLASPIIFAVEGDDVSDLPNLAPETTYATTFYAGDHGAINAKGTAIAKNGNSSVNVGATARTLTATPESGYSFDKWVTTGSVTVTDPYSESTTVSASAASGTVTATYLSNSGWYAHGEIDSYGEWGTDKKAKGIDHSYRGVSGVYYRYITKLDEDAYFGVHDGTNKYSGSTGSSDTEVSAVNTQITLYTNASKSFQAKADFAGKWLVVNTSGTKKMWIQNMTTYHTVTVSNDGSGSKGTVTLKEKSFGNLATNQFANGETIRVEIDTVAHYSIASVSLGATAVSMSYSSGTKYVGDVVMPNSDATLTVTYTPWYQVKLAASPAAAADAPTAAKTTGGATVAHNSYVLSGTSVTFTQDATPNDGYSFDHWENNSSSDGTGNTYVATISAATTVTAVYTEDDNTVAVVAGVGGTVAADNVTAHVSSKVTLPTATPSTGYYFTGWEVTEGDASLTSASSASAAQINGVTSNNTVTVRANFHADDKIYFDNTYTQWSKVYVYLFNNDVWYNEKSGDDGPGVKPNHSNRVAFAEMTKVAGEANLYEFAYHTSSENYTFSHVAFSKDNQSKYNAFYNTEAAYRNDWDANLQVYVAPAGYTTPLVNGTKYHGDKDNNAGYWRVYNPKAGDNAYYYLDKFSGTATFSDGQYFKASGDGSLVAEVTARLTTASSDYTFGVHSVTAGDAKNLHFATSHTFTVDASEDIKLYKYNSSWNITLTTTSEGDYTFILSMEKDSLRLSVIYPASVNDYRLKYTENGKSRYSDIIKKKTADAGAVTTSMYINKGGTSPSLVLEQCTAITDGEPEWTERKDLGVSSFGDAGVYVMDLTVSGTNGTTSTISNIAAYDGPYYIKTDCAKGGWADYKKNELPQNTINFSTSDAKTFDYYMCAYVGSVGTNIKCVIANDYNNQISDTLKGDDIIGAGNQTMPYAGSVRFSYNSSTNELKRSYINGSGDWENYFLELQAGSAVIKARNGSTFTDNKVKFSDNGNWIYNLELKAQEGARIKLVSHYYNGTTTKDQYFKGSSGAFDSEHTEELIGSNGGSTWQDLTIIYDFKTNNLISAWSPSGDIDATINLKTDVLLIHNRQTGGAGDVVTMINLTDGDDDGTYGDVKSVDKVYSAMRFQKTEDASYIGMTGTPANSAESYYRYNYWISFPYEVKMTDIFGISGYGSKWRIQRYAGDKRATNGWYKGDGVSSFWETMPMSDDATLNKGEGYVLQLSPSAFQATGSGSLWELSDEVYLYFPSEAGFGDIERATSSVTLTSLPCTKGLFTDGSGKSHNITDSHWHLFGIPTFSDATGTKGTGTYYDGDDAEHEHGITNNTFYFYEYANTGNSSKYNVYTATSSSGYTFQPMHAYMIQMTGTLNFTENSVPASLAARQRKETKNYDLRVELKNNEVECDHTFVTLRDSAVSEFALNEDLTKIHNSGKSNIYSYAGAYDVAANILPIESHTIALGVEAADNGYYTFTMPSYFDGEVTLVDRVAETRTNLAMSDYEVYLEKGEINDRFDLEINIKKVATAIDGGGSFKDGKAHKFIENGVLYILRDGKVYDATGNLVK